jgi:hypothetical protein
MFRRDRLDPRLSVERHEAQRNEQAGWRDRWEAILYGRAYGWWWALCVLVMIGLVVALLLSFPDLNNPYSDSG